MGSFTIPKNKRGQVTVQKFICGSADTWFAVTATAGSAGTRGTVDIHYMEARGQETIIGAIDEPILSLSPGTVNVRMIANGTATWNGVRMRTDLV